jgi:beta-barrel assembly-enhancing protease
MRKSLSAIFALALVSVSHGQFAKPSVTQQIKLGKQAAQDLRKHEKVLPESDLRVQTLRRVARRILSSSVDPKVPWEFSFDVIDSKEVNAFALPGGPTFFYTGLMDRLKTEDELAGVLGHELTHVLKEHWAHAYRDQQNRSAWITLGELIIRPSRDVAEVAGLTSSVVFDLPFSRKHETEADDGGYEAMIAAGYNPQGIEDVFKMLNNTVKGDKPPEFLSDHPADGRRIKRIAEKIAKETRTFSAMTPIPYPTNKSQSEKGQ